MVRGLYSRKIAGGGILPLPFTSATISLKFGTSFKYLLRHRESIREKTAHILNNSYQKYQATWLVGLT